MVFWFLFVGGGLLIFFSPLCDFPSALQKAPGPCGSSRPVTGGGAVPVPTSPRGVEQRVLLSFARLEPRAPRQRLGSAETPSGLRAPSLWSTGLFSWGSWFLIGKWV